MLSILFYLSVFPTHSNIFSTLCIRSFITIRSSSNIPLIFFLCQLIRKRLKLLSKYLLVSFFIISSNHKISSNRNNKKSQCSSNTKPVIHPKRFRFNANVLSRNLLINIRNNLSNLILIPHQTQSLQSIRTKLTTRQMHLHNTPFLRCQPILHIRIHRLFRNTFRIRKNIIPFVFHSVLLRVSSGFVSRSVSRFSPYSYQIPSFPQPPGNSSPANKTILYIFSALLSILSLDFPDYSVLFPYQPHHQDAIHIPIP